MYAATGAKREMGGTDFKWGAGHHWPPAGDDHGHTFTLFRQTAK